MSLPPEIPYSKFSHGIYVWNNKRGYNTISFPTPIIFPNPVSMSKEVTRNMDVWSYALNHKHEIEYKFWCAHKNPPRVYYSSCMAVCSIGDNLDTIALNYSGRHTKGKDFNPELTAIFNTKLKALPYKRSLVTYENFAVGNCAEQNAANHMVNSSNCMINQLLFSRSIRPRTMTFIAPCSNCRLLLPQIDR